jgi:hypothetical protein
MYGNFPEGDCFGRGHMRAMERGEVLYEQGNRAASFFVVVSGELEVVRPLVCQLPARYPW